MRPSKFALAGAAAVFLALAACSPTIPDSAAGVGFGASAGVGVPATSADPRAMIPLGAISPERPAGAPAPAVAASSPASTPDTLAIVAATLADRPPVDPAPATPPNAAPALVAGTGGADAEGRTRPRVARPGGADVDADGVRASIPLGHDGRALEPLAYETVTPVALPERPSSVNVAEFALATSHAPGEQRYRRAGLLGAARERSACARFSLPDEAQAAFLEAGGPERDPRGMDPDGDGFVCGFDPRIYRRMLR